jgi:hypothetical protein
VEATYTVRHIDRSTTASGAAAWTVTFQRVGGSDDLVELKLHSAVFASLDLDAVYTAHDLMRLADAGGRLD